MSPTQQFTFIDVNAGKKTNTKAIKQHVSHQTNRRKRHEAISRYQQSLLQAVERSPPVNASASASASSSSSSPEIWANQPKNTTAFPMRFRSSSTEGSSSLSQDHEFKPDWQPITVQSHQTEDFWPLYIKLASNNPKRHSSSASSGASLINTAQPPKKVFRVTCSPSQSRIFVSASTQHVCSSIPHIDDPIDQFRLERALKLCSSFIRGSHDSAWKSEWQDKNWWESSLLPLGIWRESFPLAVDFIQAGKMQEAFAILNAALNITAVLLKQGHPGLLASLLGSMLYTSLIADHKLASLIRLHITQLSIAHLGSEHPISVLLTEQMRESDLTAGRCDFITVAVLDFFSEAFGPYHHVPLSFRFGYARRQLNNGQFDAAMKAIRTLEDAWNANRQLPGLPKLFEFEKAKIVSAQQKADSIGSNKTVPNTQDLSQIADKITEITLLTLGQCPNLQPSDAMLLRQLSKRLLFGSNYAVALYIFGHVKEVFSPPQNTAQSVSTNRDPGGLPVIISRILVEHFRNTTRNQSMDDSPLSNQYRRIEDAEWDI